MNTDKLIRVVESILIDEGQHDPKFNWGDTIRYSPSEVGDILRRRTDELEDEMEDDVKIHANIPNWGKGKRRYQDDYGRLTKEGIARFFGDSKEKEKNNNEDHQSRVSDSQAGYGRSEDTDGYLQGH